MYLYKETVVDMSDYEADCLYLGRPVEDESLRHELERSEPLGLSEDDIDRMYLGLPLLAA